MPCFLSSSFLLLFCFSVSWLLDLCSIRSIFELPGGDHHAFKHRSHWHQGLSLESDCKKNDRVFKSSYQFNTLLHFHDFESFSSFKVSSLECFLETCGIVKSSRRRTSCKSFVSTFSLYSRVEMNAEDPRPILFDGQAVIGATGRTMTLPRYNAKMEAFFIFAASFTMHVCATL